MAQNIVDMDKAIGSKSRVMSHESRVSV
jgi:hypothetical protein